MRHTRFFTYANHILNSLHSIDDHALKLVRYVMDRRILDASESLERRAKFKSTNTNECE